MPTVEESLKAVNEEKFLADQKKKMSDAKPTVDMFQHISATQAAQTGLQERCGEERTLTILERDADALLSLSAKAMRAAGVRATANHFRRT